MSASAAPAVRVGVEAKRLRQHEIVGRGAAALGEFQTPVGVQRGEVLVTPLSRPTPVGRAGAGTRCCQEAAQPATLERRVEVGVCGVGCETSCDRNSTEPVSVSRLVPSCGLVTAPVHVVTVVRIDQARARVSARIEVSRQPQAIAAGPGAVWVRSPNASPAANVGGVLTPPDQDRSAHESSRGPRRARRGATGSRSVTTPSGQPAGSRCRRATIGSILAAAC